MTATRWESPDERRNDGGVLSSFETTVLMSVDETIEALRKADQVQYRAPGA